MWKSVIEITFLSNQMNTVFLLLSARGFYTRFLPCKKKKKEKKNDIRETKKTNWLFIYLNYVPQIHAFYKQHFYEENLAETGKK